MWVEDQRPRCSEPSSHLHPSVDVCLSGGRIAEKVKRVSTDYCPGSINRNGIFQQKRQRSFCPNGNLVKCPKLCNCIVELVTQLRSNLIWSHCPRAGNHPRSAGQDILAHFRCDQREVLKTKDCQRKVLYPVFVLGYLQRPKNVFCLFCTLHNGSPVLWMTRERQTSGFQVSKMFSGGKEMSHLCRSCRANAPVFSTSVLSEFDSLR